MAKSRRVYLEILAIPQDIPERELESVPVATAKMIEFLQPTSILHVASLLGPHFHKLVSEIESERAA